MFLFPLCFSLHVLRALENMFHSWHFYQLSSIKQRRQKLRGEEITARSCVGLWIFCTFDIGSVIKVKGGGSGQESTNTVIPN